MIYHSNFLHECYLIYISIINIDFEFAGVIAKFGICFIFKEKFHLNNTHHGPSSIKSYTVNKKLKLVVSQRTELKQQLCLNKSLTYCG